MQEQDNEQFRPGESAEPSQTPQDVSAFRNAFTIRAEEQRREELAERKRQKDAEEAAYQAREEYAKELAEEKVDLIRLRQGVITEEELGLTKDEEKHYTLRQKIGNWFYHSKWWLGIASFCVLIAAFLIYDYVTRVDPDLYILTMTDNDAVYLASQNITDWITPQCSDYDGDGKVIVQPVYLPVSKDSMSGGAYAQSYNSQLLIQFESATCMIMLLDAESETYISPEERFCDLSELYPDCPFADGCRLRLEGTNFTALAGIDGALNAGSYLALRRPVENMNSLEENQETYDRAKPVFDWIVSQLQPAEQAEQEAADE